MEIASQGGATEARLADLVLKVRDAFRRRLLTFIIVSAAIFAVGVTLIFLMTPRYDALTRIRIDPSRNPMAINSGEDKASLETEAIDTEVSALDSPDLAREVVKRLHLQLDPEFTKGIEPAGPGSTITEDERLTATAQRVSLNLGVARERQTYIIDVSFRSIDPIKAARIANEFARAYLDAKVGLKIGTAQRQSAFLDQRLTELGNEVRAADEQLAAYRARAGIVEGGQNGTITDQQVAPLASALASAESDAAAASTTLATARQQVARGGVDAVSDVRNSPVIQDLRRQRAEILSNMDEVSARYGDKHPETLRARDQLATVDTQIKDEAARVISSLNANAAAASARAGSLRSSMSRLESQQANNTRASVVADSLERVATAKHAAYDKTAQMAVEGKQATQNSIAQAEVVDVAQPPLKPASPNKPLFLALALIASLGAGAGTVLVQEMLVAGMRTVEEVETQLGIPVLAVVPRVANTERPADILLDKPTSLFAEAFRNARASLLGVRSEAPPRVIAVTSALPNEGKTTAALAMARTMAINGNRTLLLECDVRRAQVRQMIDNPPEGPGLVEVIRGEAAVQDAITPGGIDNLDHLLVHAPYFSSENLFGTDRMPRLLQELAKTYEVIVLDLPPLVGLADGRFLAALADAVALIIRWDVTPVQAVKSALGWLRADGANIAGAIYTMVDTKAEAIGGLYYSKKYSSYYEAA